MALDVTRAHAEIDTLALVAATVLREREGQIAALQAERAGLLEQVTDLQRRLAEVTPTTRPIRWGSSVEARGLAYPAALARVEATMGKLDTVRYFRAGGPLWNPNLTGLGGRGIVYSARTMPSAVLSGSQDGAWRAWFREAVGYLEKWPDTEIGWDWWHEPEDDVEAGRITATDWRAAFRYLIELQRREFLHPRLFSIPILMAWTANPASKRKLSDYLIPEADVQGWDTYIGLGAANPQQAVDPLAANARVTGQPWAVCECGVSANTPNRNAALTGLAQRLATADPPPRFVTYFNSDPDTVPKGWPIDTDPKAAAAWLAGRSS